MCVEECVKELTIKHPHGAGARKQHVAGLWNQNQMFSKARKAIIGREF